MKNLSWTLTESDIAAIIGAHVKTKGFSVVGRPRFNAERGDRPGEAASFSVTVQLETLEKGDPHR